MRMDVSEISFSYGSVNILDGISFQARPGEITSIIGPNGAGKTTLLKCVADLAKHEGKVLFDGEEKTREDMNEFLSYMEQSTDLDVELNVFEIVLLGMVQSLSFYVSEEDIQAVNDVLDLLDIRQFAQRKIGEISGGQRQLVFIAQALIKKPSVLIMDEPTSALDLYHQFKLMEFISRITKELNCVTIMTLHHLDVALKYSDNMVVVKDHKVYSEGSPEDVFTEEMLSEVYNVNSKILTDDGGDRHLVVIGPKGIK